MTGEMEALKLGISVFEQIITNPSLMDIMISGKEKDQTARVGVIVRSIVNQPEAQKVFLKKIIETLSQEGESDQTDRRDAVLGVLMTPVIVDILPGNQIVIFDGYLEALGCQTKDNDPYSGSVQSLLDAGIFLAPYFPQDELSKTQLRNLLEQMAQQFSFPGERRHILAFVEDILENATVLGSRDARVKYWKLRKLKEKEISNCL